MNTNEQTYTFHVHGMHCKACVVLTESELMTNPNISQAKSFLDSRTVKITGQFGEKNPVAIAEELSKILKPYGYTLGLEKEKFLVNWADFKFAVPFAFGFIGLFIILQKLGIVNLVTASEVGYGTAFVIGLIASVSTCMAVVGGLVLSMSASFAKEENNLNTSTPYKLQPQIFFHVGRLVSFFVLGGVIGLLGSAFQLGVTGTFILNFIIAVVLLILGINLLDIFPGFKKFQPTLPGFLGKRIHNLKNFNHILTPILIGIATFFLPCGFTQSMQIYALSTGNFLTGALIMLAFALGTFPVLALLSISSLGIHKKTQTGIFFKTAGLVVIFFGIFNLLNALVAGGYIPPLFNF